MTPGERRADRPRVRFGPFEADFATQELFKSGRKVRLAEQPFRILEFLLERPGEVVSREELRDRLWPKDTFVDFDHGLNAAVNRLRERLSDVSERPRYIETLPRRGYRFIAEVEKIEPQAVDAVPEAAPRRVLKPVLIAALASMAAIALLVFRTSHQDAGSIHSIAVLPLENLSGGADEDYFADGMTDELITDLAKIQSLRLISRTSVMMYKNAKKPLRKIAEELGGVDAIVEGSVTRAGGTVRITAQLVRVADDRHLWAESYARDARDVILLQSEVALAIAGQIRAVVTAPERQQLIESHPVNPEAYEAYLRSRYFIHDQRSYDGGLRSIEYARKAVEIDPGYAEAHAALAEAYISGAYFEVGPAHELMPLAEQAARKALELAPGLAAAHVGLGMIASTYTWDWPKAEAELKLATKLDPNNVEASVVYANYLAQVGRLPEAIVESRRAARLDPLSLWANRDVGRMLLYSHDYDGALQQFQKLADMYPASQALYNWTSAAYKLRGQTAQAVEMTLKKIQMDGEPPEHLDQLRAAYRSSGESAFWRKAVEFQRNRTKNRAADYLQAIWCGWAGDRNQAFSFLERAYQARSVWIAFILVDPQMDPLRSDPRFAGYLEKMGLAKR